MIRATLLAATVITVAGAAYAAETTVPINLVTGTGLGDSVGNVTFSDSADGLVITPMLHGLTPGEHGFHVHANADCGPMEKDGKMTPALAAGGHYDPAETGKHEGPQGEGHLGDLPVLVVGEDGTAMEPLLAPRLKVEDLAGRALMIHQGGDNYADEPAPLGGGGPRVACGVIE
jgi:Cu-Zn family superoxide dismutase